MERAVSLQPQPSWSTGGWSRLESKENGKLYGQGMRASLEGEKALYGKIQSIVQGDGGCASQKITYMERALGRIALNPRPPGHFNHLRILKTR